MPDADQTCLLLPHAAAPADEQSAAYSHAGWEILLCRSGGKLFAVENRCTHRAQKLQDGPVRRGFIVCPHHGARFALTSGAPAGPPAIQALRTFPCRDSPEGVVIGLPKK